MSKKRNRHSWEQDLAKNEEGKYVCLIDDKVFGSFRGLETHLKTKYEGKKYPTYLVEQGLVNEDSFIRCLECGEYVKTLSTHIRQHGLTKDTYTKKYNYKCEWTCKSTTNKFSELSKGENNVMHKNNTTEEFRKSNSPFSKEFYLKRNANLTNKESELKVKKFAKEALENRVTETQLEYWINKCDGDIIKAKKLYSERQSTFSKEKCIERYGEDEGLKIWEERQEKWQKSLLENGNMKTGYSKVSQELFDSIKEYYEDVSNIYYATEKGERIIRDSRNYQYDFTDEDKKLIIEYNGDQYHANPNIYEANDYPHPYRKGKGHTASDIWNEDLVKREIAKKKGYSVLYVWDSEYKKDKEGTLDKCLEFLGLK